MDVKRHSDIVDAIETGDADKAEATIREHMVGAAETLVAGAAQPAAERAGDSLTKSL